MSSNEVDTVVESMQDGEAIPNGNDNVLFSVESAENAPHKEVRVIRKAKRSLPGSTSPKQQDGNIVDGVSHVQIGGESRLPYTKNSRKSRNAFHRRGLPKKGGAGGKGVWGKMGSELGVTGEASDENDPNYDSDTQNEVLIDKMKLTDEELSKRIQPILCEYLENADTRDAITSLMELKMRGRRYKAVVLCVLLAMERHNPERELVSVLISDMYGTLLHEPEIEKGFDELLSTLDDTVLDTPEAPTLLGQFIARAVADDCVTPKFVNSYKGKVESQHTRQALAKADVLLNMKHGLVRLDNVWGTGGGVRPVKFLMNRIDMILKEYLSSGDVTEASRCLRELEVPHFHHEFVYEALYDTLENSCDHAMDLVVKLFKYLASSNSVTPDQMIKGVRRIFDDMPDIYLDVPAAYNVLDRLSNKMHDAGVLNEELYRDCPSRGRKRFVSEGDGGRFKGVPNYPL